ncbi:sugar phosphate nucleotidyltransferase [Escherichia coli]|uniref:sugar phosphate nucleotidyltransferase n=1 Tax=Escherichia coli TaxID=562 RepID=UPI0031F62129
MVSLEKNDHLMLARQLPLKSVALILAGGRGTRLKDLTNKRAKPPYTSAVSSALSTLRCLTASTPGSVVWA